MQTFIIAQEINSSLAKDVAIALKVPMYEVRTTRFADSELQVTLKDDKIELQGGHAVVVHSTSRPVHDNLIELLCILQMLKKNKLVDKITAVIPYFGYARQDKQDDGESIVHFVLRLLREAGADHIVAVELHNPAIAINAPLPVTNIKLDSFIAAQIHRQGDHAEWTIIAPDRGAFDRADTIAQNLKVPVIVCDKERYAVNKTRVTSASGSCDSFKGIIIDDIIDTGASMINVVDRLHEEHSSCQMFAFGIHPVLSGNALDTLQKSVFKRILITNTIAWQKELLPSKFEMIDISAELARVLAEIIL